MTPSMTIFGLAASALLVSTMPHLALANQASDHHSDGVCGSELGRKTVENRSASQPLRIAEDAFRYSSPGASKDRTRRPSEQRRPVTRRPVNPVPAADCLATGTCAQPTQQRRQRPRSDNTNPLQERMTISSTGMERLLVADGAPSEPALVSTTCAASVGLKNISPALRQRLLALGASQEARNCARAVEKLSPLRDRLQAAYENALPEDQSVQFTEAAADYIAYCLGDNLLLDQGALTPADESFLRAHTGFIVKRTRTAPHKAKPVCQAARLGKLVVTAQHCVPAAAASYGVDSDTASQVAFRFLDRPALYDLAPRLLNAAAERHLDYAILEIVGAPELWEDVAPLVGKIELFSDFYNLTANIYVRIVDRQRGDTAIDFGRAALFEHSTLCRPAYIAPNGLFLHACQTEAGLSGTPLFQRQHGRLAFVGMHNGVTEALEDPSLAACAHGLPNYGVSVPPSALLGIQPQ